MFGAQAADEQLVLTIPGPVKTAITREARGAAVLSLERLDESPVLYRATLKLDGREYLLTVDADGRLDRLELRAQEEQSDPKLENFPAPVKAALVKLSDGASVDRAEQERHETTFSVVVTQGGSKFRITVDEQGKLIRKERVDE